MPTSSNCPNASLRSRKWSFWSSKSETDKSGLTPAKSAELRTGPLNLKMSNKLGKSSESSDTNMPLSLDMPKRLNHLRICSRKGSSSFGTTHVKKPSNH